MQEGISYNADDIKYLFAVAKHCARSSGLAVAGATAIATSTAGAVTLPIVGAVPGWVAGALAGFIGGTTVCVMGRAALKPALDQIVEARAR